MARKAIEAYLEVMHEDGLPVPAVQRGRVAVRAVSLKLPALTGGS